MRAMIQNDKACQRSRHASHQTGLMPMSFARNRTRRLALPYFHQRLQLSAALEDFVAFCCQVRGIRTQLSARRIQLMSWLAHSAAQKGERPIQPAVTNR